MNLHYTLDGQGPERVVMLHDWIGDSKNYDTAMPYFDPAALTIARIDLPGYGASRAMPVGGVDAPNLDAKALAVVDQLGWSRFHLVAHSMSTVIAQRIARSHPQRLSSMTLVTPVTPGTLVPEEIASKLRVVGLELARRRPALQMILGARLSPRWLEFKAERWIASSDPAAVAAYVELFCNPRLPTTRAEQQLRVLVVTGADDAPPFQRPAVEAAFKPVYPDAVFEECANVGHYPMQESPPRFAALVERFVLKNL